MARLWGAVHRLDDSTARCGRRIPDDLAELATVGLMEPTTGGSEQHTQVIWSREIDHDAIAQRWRKFGLYFVLPSVIALLVALVAGGVGAFLGVLILLGLFGLLLFTLVFFKNFNARANATIELAGDDLVMGRRRVDLSRVEAWSTAASGEDWGIRDQALFGNPMSGNAITARVSFRLAVYDDAGQRAVRPGGGPAYEVVSLAWAMMPPDHLDRLRVALEPYVDAPLVPADELRA